MLKKPSSRRKSEQSEIELNLIPILDALVTLIAFLLFSSTMMAIAIIETPAPLLAPASEQIEKIKEKPLQLTATIRPTKIFIADWSGSRETHTIPSVTDPQTGESRYDVESFHKTLVEIKNRHPKETKLIFKPDGGVAYEAIIELMDSARMLEKTDPPFFIKDATGVEKPETKLFSEVIFGNIMS